MPWGFGCGLVRDAIWCAATGDYPHCSGAVPAPLVPLGDAFTRITAILGHGGCAAVSAQQLTEQFMSICVAARRASSRALFALIVSDLRK